MNRVPLLIFVSSIWFGVGATTTRGEFIYDGSTITENFDTLPTSNVASFFSATIGAQSSITLASGGFDGAKIAGTGITATALTADTGSSNSGAIYSFGAASDTDRALGTVASGTNIFGFGFQLRNNTAQMIDSVTIAFTQETWRNSTSTVNIFAASWSTTANAADYLSTTTGFTAITDLDLIGPAPVTTNGMLDGNLAVNQTPKLATINNLSLAGGQSLFVRWQDVNDNGSDAGLAIDELTISASVSAVPEPSSLLFAALGLVAGAASYRRARHRFKECAYDS